MSECKLRIRPSAESVDGVHAYKCDYFNHFVICIIEHFSQKRFQCEVDEFKRYISRYAIAMVQFPSGVDDSSAAVEMHRDSRTSSEASIAMPYFT